MAGINVTKRIFVENADQLKKFRKSAFQTMMDQLGKIANGITGSDVFVRLDDSLKPDDFKGPMGKIRQFFASLNAAWQDFTGAIQQKIESFNSLKQKGEQAAKDVLNDSTVQEAIEDVQSTERIQEAFERTVKNRGGNTPKTANPPVKAPKIIRSPDSDLWNDAFHDLISNYRRDLNKQRQSKQILGVSDFFESIQENIAWRQPTGQTLKDFRHYLVTNNFIKEEVSQAEVGQLVQGFESWVKQLKNQEASESIAKALKAQSSHSPKIPANMLDDLQRITDDYASSLNPTVAAKASTNSEVPGVSALQDTTQKLTEKLAQVQTEARSVFSHAHQPDAPALYGAKAIGKDRQVLQISPSSLKSGVNLKNQVETAVAESFRQGHDGRVVYDISQDILDFPKLYEQGFRIQPRPGHLTDQAAQKQTDAIQKIHQGVESLIQKYEGAHKVQSREVFDLFNNPSQSFSFAYLPEENISEIVKNSAQR